jgi:hypothetical protein
MSDLFQIFKSEFNSLTPFQKKLHLIDDKDNTYTISSDYTNNFHEKVAMRSQITRDLKSRIDSNKVVYQVNNNSPLDLLEWISMSVLTPRIVIRDKFKDEYRVCWKSNLCHEIIDEATHCYDDDIKQTIDGISLISYRNWLLEQELDLDLYLESIGNIKQLLEWSNILPQEDLNWFQPWLFNESKDKSIPLYMCRKSTITFEYKYNLDISKHLLMKRLVNGKWIDCLFDRKIIEKVPFEYKIKQPTLKGFYVSISQEEKQRRMQHPNGNLYNYYDFIPIKGRNNIRLNYKDTLDLRSIYPCKAIFIIPINKSSNVQCFTYKSNTIIGSVKILYQKDKEKVELCSSNFINTILSRKFPRRPYEKGIAGIPLTNKYICINSDVATTFANEMDAQLLVDYRDTDPYLNQENEDNNESDEEENEVNIENVKKETVTKSDRFQINYLYMVSKQLEFVNGICKKEEISE